MYERKSAATTAPALEWVLVANAARARCFERDADNGAMREIEGFVHPASRLKGLDLGNDRGGLAHKGVASTQFAPATAPHEIATITTATARQAVNARPLRSYEASAPATARPCTRGGARPRRTARPRG